MSEGDREILASFDCCRGKTLALLKIVPAKLLAQKTAGEELSLGELFHHIAASSDGWMARCMQDGGTMPCAYAASKPAISKALSASRRRLLAFFKADGGARMDSVFTPSRRGKTYRFVGRNRVCYLTQHEVHHRGKIILALRQWGVTDIPFMPFDND
jgi:uncharacterized damage-inducible protein DinB